MKPWSIEPVGTWHEDVIESAALTGNPLGDPASRPLWVYLPPGSSPGPAEPGRALPTIYVLQGLTGQLDMWRNRSAFRPSVLELIDGAFAAPGQAPAVVVLVDAWTSLGGSQFLNSPGTGRYLDYVTEEVVSFVDRHYPTAAEARCRAVAGKSSGGYGAMVLPMLAPGVFGGLATHAGDAGFELCYLSDVAEAARALRERYEGSYDAFWADFRSRPAMSRPEDAALVNTYCMAACYSAEEDGSVALPFDPGSGRLVDEVFTRWQAFDPLRLAAHHGEALRSLRAVWVDAGRHDQYFLDLGATAFHAILDQLGVEHAFELFEGTHSAIEYRYPLALGYLAARLQPGP